MSFSIGSISAAHSTSAMSGASTSMAPSPKMAALFDRIDSAGQGSISKSQLEGAFGTQNPPGVFKALGADALYSQLDPAGTGSVSKQQFVTRMTGLMSSLRNSAATQGAAAPGATVSPSSTIGDSLQSLSGASGSLDISV